MFIVIRKLSRLVSTNWPRSSFLSEKPIAWTTKSIVSQRAFSSRRRDRDVAMSDNVAVDQEGGAQLLGERADPLLHRFALIGESELGAVLATAPWRCPRRASLSLARPMIRPRLPSIKPVIPSPFSQRRLVLRLHGFLNGFMLGLGGGLLVDHLDVLVGRRRRFGERRVELRADNQAQTDDEEEKQRDDHAGEAAVGEVVAGQAARGRPAAGPWSPPTRA